MSRSLIIGSMSFCLRSIKVAHNGEPCTSLGRWLELKGLAQKVTKKPRSGSKRLSGSGCLDDDDQEDGSDQDIDLASPQFTIGDGLGPFSGLGVAPGFEQGVLSMGGAGAAAGVREQTMMGSVMCDEQLEMTPPPGTPSTLLAASAAAGRMSPLHQPQQQRDVQQQLLQQQFAGPLATSQMHPAMNQGQIRQPRSALPGSFEAGKAAVDASYGWDGIGMCAAGVNGSSRPASASLHGQPQAAAAGAVAIEEQQSAGFQGVGGPGAPLRGEGRGGSGNSHQHGSSDGGHYTAGGGMGDGGLGAWLFAGEPEGATAGGVCHATAVDGGRNQQGLGAMVGSSIGASNTGSSWGEAPAAGAVGGRFMTGDRVISPAAAGDGGAKASGVWDVGSILASPERGSDVRNGRGATAEPQDQVNSRPGSSKGMEAPSHAAVVNGATAAAGVSAPLAVRAPGALAPVGPASSAAVPLGTTTGYYGGASVGAAAAGGGAAAAAGTAAWNQSDAFAVQAAVNAANEALALRTGPLAGQSYLPMQGRRPSSGAPAPGQAGYGMTGVGLGLGGPGGAGGGAYGGPMHGRPAAAGMGPAGGGRDMAGFVSGQQHQQQMLLHDRMAAASSGRGPPGGFPGPPAAAHVGDFSGSGAGTFRSIDAGGYAQRQQGYVGGPPHGYYGPPNGVGHQQGPGPNSFTGAASGPMSGPAPLAHSFSAVDGALHLLRGPVGASAGGSARGGGGPPPIGATGTAGGGNVMREEAALQALLPRVGEVADGVVQLTRASYGKSPAAASKTGPPGAAAAARAGVAPPAASGPHGSDPACVRSAAGGPEQGPSTNKCQADAEGQNVLKVERPTCVGGAAAAPAAGGKSSAPSGHHSHVHQQVRGKDGRFASMKHAPGYLGGTHVKQQHQQQQQQGPQAVMYVRDVTGAQRQLHAPVLLPTDDAAASSKSASKTTPAAAAAAAAVAAMTPHTSIRQDQASSPGTAAKMEAEAAASAAAAAAVAAAGGVAAGVERKGLVPPPLVVDMEVDMDPTVLGDDSQWLQSPLRKTPGRMSGAALAAAAASKGGAAGAGGCPSAKAQAAAVAAGNELEQGGGSGAEGGSAGSGDVDEMVDQVIEEGEGEEEGGISVGPEHQADLPEWKADPRGPKEGAEDQFMQAQQRAADLAKAGLPGPKEEEAVQQVVQVRGVGGRGNWPQDLWSL